MLREQARGLRSSVLIDLVFGTDAAPRKPTTKEITHLKNAIAVELTTNEFARCSKVTDIDSAELFRRTNDSLESMQRQQIMANRIFADALSSSIFKSRRQSPSASAASEDAASTTTQENATIRSDSIGEPERNVFTPVGKSLHYELLRIMNPDDSNNNKTLTGDPSQKLADRLSFLKKLIQHKTTGIVSWTRLMSLLSGIFSQAAAVLFGDEDEGQKDSSSTARADGASVSSRITSMEDANMATIGVDFVFGAATDIIEKNLTRVCTDIGELALFLNIPVVLLPWPAEYIRSPDYKTLLMRSISAFSAKAAIPSMYILDQIIFDDEQKNETDRETTDNALKDNQMHDIFSEKCKKVWINKVYNNIRAGGKERELMSNVFAPSWDVLAQDGNALAMVPDSASAYIAAASVIDDTVPVFDNLLNGIMHHLDKRKQLINRVVAKLLKKTKLAVTVYCINKRLNNAAAKCENAEEEEDAPLQDLTFRSTTAHSRAFPTPKSPVGRGQAQFQPPFTPVTNCSSKRPSHDLLASRVKRLRARDALSDDDDEEISDDDTDSGSRDG